MSNNMVVDMFYFLFFSIVIAGVVIGLAHVIFLIFGEEHHKNNY